MSKKIADLRERLISAGEIERLGSAFSENEAGVIPALLANAVKSDMIAEVVSDIYGMPLYCAKNVDSIDARGKGYLLSGDGVMYVSNPMDAVLIRSLSSRYIAVIRGWGVISNEHVEDVEESMQVAVDYEALNNQAEATLAEIIDSALKVSASDIHLQPAGNRIQLRMRIDGEMTLQDNLDRDKAYIALANRLLDKSGHNAGEFIRPASGKFQWKTPRGDIDIRMEMASARSGGFDSPKFTLRLMGQNRQLADLSRLGLPEFRGNQQMSLVRRLAAENNGIFLVTGPTGSGKTTTLMAILRLIKTMSPGRSIHTLEDPVENEVPELCQIEINHAAGMSFAAGLRSLLRHDPDVILVGEIRDSETMNLALEAALTGHLVFATLHTNSALEAIPRMLNKGADPDLLADALRGVMAQRMVRRVCEHCSIEVEWGELMEMTPDALTAVPDPNDQEVYKSAEQRYRDVKSMPDPRDRVRVHGTGCSKCSGQGYKGRHLISEMMVMDTKMRELISSRAPTETMRKHLASDQVQYPGMWNHAGRLIGQGMTTLTECEKHLNRAHAFGWNFSYTKEVGAY